jgi:hypothetical protein
MPMTQIQAAGNMIDVMACCHMQVESTSTLDEIGLRRRDFDISYPIFPLMFWVNE